MPKAAPVGARLNSALARQTRAKKAVEAADKMLKKAQLGMKETMTEMEQANIAVEVAKKKVVPATGLASERRGATHAADTGARTEGRREGGENARGETQGGHACGEMSGNPTDANERPGDRGSRDCIAPASSRENETSRARGSITSQ